MKILNRIKYILKEEYLLIEDFISWKKKLIDKNMESIYFKIDKSMYVDLFRIDFIEFLL